MTNKRKRIQPGDIAAAVESARIPPEARDPKLYYYEMMHSESDWTQPIEIKPWAFVNFLGTLVMNRPLELVEASYTPTWKEKRVIGEKMARTPARKETKRDCAQKSKHTLSGRSL